LGLMDRLRLNVSRSFSTSGICDAIEDDYPFMVFTNDTA